MAYKRHSPRYVVREIEGNLEAGVGGSATGGLSVSVHDGWYGYSTRAVYRTEDYVGVKSRELRRRLARAHAQAMADTLEAWHAA